MQTKSYRNGTTPGAGAPLPVLDDLGDDRLGALLDEYDSLIGELAQALDAASAADTRLTLILERVHLQRLAIEAAIARAAGRIAGGA